jgi:hypothetical protein
MIVAVEVGTVDVAGTAEVVATLDVVATLEVVATLVVGTVERVVDDELTDVDRVVVEEPGAGPVGSGGVVPLVRSYPSEAVMTTWKSARY